MVRFLVYALVSILPLSSFLFSCASVGKSASVGRSVIDNPMRYAVGKLRASVQSVRDPLKLPVSAKPDSAWKTAGMYDWRSGFFPGCLWYAFEYSRDDSLKAAAIRWTEGLEPVKNYTANHDVGFMMFCSYGNGYRLTGNPAYKDVLLQSARSLSTRFNPTVGCILSWNPNSRWKFPVIVDNMMNLELLFWAAKNGGGDDLRKIAETHALTTMKNHVRPDGSTFHVIDYDPSTGEVRARNTAQGYADGSAWSRGQAWGIYGFTMTYRETKNPLFLETATKIADYYIAHLPADLVPYWDFQAPNIPDEPRDSSAAAIAASGLLELAGFVQDRTKAESYRATAISILKSLSAKPYLTAGTNTPAVLAHATGAKPNKSEVDVSLIYGDYYFMEALLRLKRGM